MSSLTWSKNKKQTNRNREDFTPNIYRKPVKNEDTDGEQEQTVSYPGDQGRAGPSRQNQKLKELESDLEHLKERYEAEIREYREKETVLAEVKARYESEMEEYRQKQDHLKHQTEDISRQEKELNRKCALLKSASAKVDDIIPKVETDDFNEKRSAFEKQKADFAKQVEEFESSKVEYEKQLSEFEQNKSVLSDQQSSYEEDMQAYLEKKSDLEEKARLLEEQLSSGNDVTLDLEGLNYSGAVEIVKSRYYSELKELNRKRADLRTLREELESEESLLLAKSSGVDEIKAQVEAEFSKLKPRANELEASIQEYEENLKKHEDDKLLLSELVSKQESERALFKQRQSELEELENVQAKQEYALIKRKIAAFESGKLLKLEVCRINSLAGELAGKVSEFENNITSYESDLQKYEENLKVHTENESKLSEAISKYEFDLKSYEEKRSELEELKKSLSSSQDSLKEEQAEIETQRKELDVENESLKVYRKEVEVQRTELESELQSIKSKRENNEHLEKEIETTSTELEAKRKELEELLDATRKEIGTQVTVHRQHLDLKKMSTKLEQQSVYIQTLNKSLEQMQSSLEDSRKNSVFYDIVKTNIELMK